MIQSLGYEVAAVMPAAVETGLFFSLATFQSSDAADFPDGFYSGDYQDVPGLVNLPCMAPPEASSSIQATEVKALADITSSELHHVLLNGYYATADMGWRNGWQLLIGDNDGSGNLINGVVYDLLGVEADSQKQMTRCRVRLTTI